MCWPESDGPLGTMATVDELRELIAKVRRFPLGRRSSELERLRPQERKSNQQKDGEIAKLKKTLGMVVCADMRVSMCIYAHRHTQACAWACVDMQEEVEKSWADGPLAYGPLAYGPLNLEELPCANDAYRRVQAA